MLFVRLSLAPDHCYVFESRVLGRSSMLMDEKILVKIIAFT